MLIAAQDWLLHGAGPDRAAIREHLSGNYCRCTGYEAIVDAVAATWQAPAWTLTRPTARTPISAARCRARTCSG